MRSSKVVYTVNFFSFNNLHINGENNLSHVSKITITFIENGVLWTEATWFFDKLNGKGVANTTRRLFTVGVIAIGKIRSLDQNLSVMLARSAARLFLVNSYCTNDIS